MPKTDIPKSINTAGQPREGLPAKTCSSWITCAEIIAEATPRTWLARCDRGNIYKCRIMDARAATTDRPHIVVNMPWFRTNEWRPINHRPFNRWAWKTNAGDLARMPAPQDSESATD